MDGATYTSSSSSYPSLAGLTLDTTPYIDTQDVLSSASSSAGPSSGHPFKKERDGTDKVSPAGILTGSSRSLSLSTNSSAMSSNITDFTKRKNWSKRIIDELKDLLHVLSPAAKIMYCSPSSLELVGYTPEELVGRHLTEFIHVDDVDMFIREFNMSVHTRGEFKLYYRFRKKDDKFIILEVVGHPYYGDPGSLSITPKCFFAMAQPYPTKASSMLDSFLELKIENELLRHKLRTIRARQQQHEHLENNAATRSSARSNSKPVPLPPPPPSEDDFTGDPDDDELTGPVTSLLDDPDLDHDLLSSRPGVIVGKGIAVHTSGVHLSTALPETVELFTGLRFAAGERAKGVSRGLPGAILLKAMEEVGMEPGDLPDAPKPIPSRSSTDGVTVIGPSNVVSDKAGGGGAREGEKAKPRKKKKPKMEEDEYVCTDCGTTESPEWRKGPTGPKTLCNACGLRWAKKNKKSGLNAGTGFDGDGIDDLE